MGTWGPALFSNDTACDVRDAYRELVGDGLSGPAATDRIMKEWEEALDDPDEGPVFWFALASTQWRCGRLESRVRDRALALIDDGSDLHRWGDDGKLLRKRQAVLAKLREQLLSPQPPEKRIARRFRDTCDWEVGEVVGFRLRSGNLALLRVIGYHSDEGGVSPVVELLDWSGSEVPQERELDAVGIRTKLQPQGEISQFMLGRTRERELPAERVIRPGVKLRPYQEPRRYRVFQWKQLDETLERAFDLS